MGLLARRALPLTGRSIWAGRMFIGLNNHQQRGRGLVMPGVLTSKLQR